MREFIKDIIVFRFFCKHILPVLFAIAGIGLAAIYIYWDSIISALYNLVVFIAAILGVSALIIGIPFCFFKYLKQKKVIPFFVAAFALFLTCLFQATQNTEHHTLFLNGSIVFGICTIVFLIWGIQKEKIETLPQKRFEETDINPFREWLQTNGKTAKGKAFSESYVTAICQTLMEMGPRKAKELAEHSTVQGKRLPKRARAAVYWYKKFLGM